MLAFLNRVLAYLPWPLLRLAAIITVVLVTGLAGLESGLRTAGGLLILLAVIQLLRRYAGNASSCEVSGQLPVGPALFLLMVQIGLGILLLVRPGWIMAVLGV
ncbi:hypothetical protein [Thioalkalivibrio sulfidiphilus]|uniref:hypothetical protein n=1 Tax=Thioalkalivibrio sulfidiphilus TaxID=1033854 RepID=UPI000366F27A|nr:hypothetical protein [Thioalkalivibrio sulfidiphilus]